MFITILKVSWAVSAYLGVPIAVLVLLQKHDDGIRDLEDNIEIAFFWPFVGVILVLVSPILLLNKITEHLKQGPEPEPEPEPETEPEPEPKNRGPYAIEYVEPLNRRWKEV